MVGTRVALKKKGPFYVDNLDFCSKAEARLIHIRDTVSIVCNTSTTSTSQNKVICVTDQCHSSVSLFINFGLWFLFPIILLVSQIEISDACFSNSVIN